MTVTFLSLFWWILSLPSQAETTHFKGGRILTHFSSEYEEVVSELVVSNGKVIAAGKNLTPPRNAVTVDLKNDWVMPALSDSHVHLLETGSLSDRIDLRGKSVTEIQKSLTESIKRNPLMSVVVGFGWDQTLWNPAQYPKKTDLDIVSSTLPIILFRVDGHAAWVNSLALKRAQLSGEGIIIDKHLNKIEALIPEKSIQEKRTAFEAVVKRALSLGITSLHDAGISNKDYLILKDWVRDTLPPIRLFEMASSQNKSELEKVLSMGPEKNLFSDRLHRRTVKIYLDGALGSRGALLEFPYSDDPSRSGIQMISEKELEALIRKADNSGFQVAVHAIGDKANRLALESFRKIWGKNTKLKRPRLEHAQVLSKKLISEISLLGIIASIQPVHFESDQRWYKERLGEERSSFAYAWKPLSEAGAILSFGSDSPIEDLNPSPGIQSALSRGLNIYQVFDGFTHGATYASFQEDTLGRLLPGFWADFVVLKENPLRSILQSHDKKGFSDLIQATYFSGKKVFSRR